MHLWAADGDLELHPEVICAGWKEKDLGMVARAIIEPARLAAAFAGLGIRGHASKARRMQLCHARIAGTSARQGRRRPRAGAGIALPLPLKDGTRTLA